MSSTQKFTTESVEERFEEAARTLKRLSIPRLKPQGYFNGWPDIIYTTWELEMQDKLPLRLGPPPADQISRMEEALGWLWWLEPDERNLVWMRAGGVRWKVICYRIGYSRETMRTKHKIALTRISARLNAKK